MGIGCVSITVTLYFDKLADLWLFSPSEFRYLSSCDSGVTDRVVCNGRIAVGDVQSTGVETRLSTYVYSVQMGGIACCSSRKDFSGE